MELYLFPEPEKGKLTKEQKNPTRKPLHWLKASVQSGK